MSLSLTGGFRVRPLALSVVRPLSTATSNRVFTSKGKSHTTRVKKVTNIRSGGRPAVKILVIDGYFKEGRAELTAGGAGQAGELYSAMLDQCSPVGCESDVVFPADDDFTLPPLENYDGVAWTGSSATIYHTHEEGVQKQIELAKELYAKRIPQFGSCWAAQMAAVAAGGDCTLNPRGREMGLSRKISLTPEGRAHPMFEGKPTVFDAFTSHNDMVSSLPRGGLALASNNWTAVQACAVTHNGGTFWAVQWHPEYDLHELAMLTYCRAQKLIEIGYFVDEEDCHRYVDRLDTLHKDPSRMDIAWQLGFDDDVMSEDIRLVEVRNWITKQAMPFQALRRGL